MVFSDAQGRYTLAPLAAGGPLAVKLTRDWFKPAEQTATLATSGLTTLDLTIEEVPITLDPADKTAAEAYARTFDWSKQAVSITVAARPTRRDFDNAVYYRNPALFRDTSREQPLTPAPAPEITGTGAAGGAKNFTFPLRSGTRMGEEAVELATIVDALKDTPLGAEPAEIMNWTPMIKWLGEWDLAKAADLTAVGVAVRQQSWGGNALRPQEIQRVFLDPASRTLWAEVAFAPFVQVGAGITDNDGDGRKEIYARVPTVHYGAEMVDKLANEYGKTMFNTHGLSKEVTKSLNELYSTTGAQVERFIGQPFEVPGVGAIKYPFVVLRHMAGQKNVILVAPGP